MTNSEIKKAILESIKGVTDTYIIDLVLLTGDGEGHQEGHEPLYNTLTVWEDANRDEMLYDIEFSEYGTVENDENIKILKAEQKKMSVYLNKHFKNIKVMEGHV